MANFDDEDDEDAVDTSNQPGTDDQSDNSDEQAPAEAEEEAPTKVDDDEEPDEGASVPPSQSASLLAQPDKAAMMKAYLQANDDTGVRNAIANSQKQNMISNIGSALDTIATANSAAHGGKGSDPAFWQGLQAQGQQGVKQAQDQRQAALNNFAQQNEIQRQVALQTMQKGNYEQQQKASQFVNDQNDADSQISQNARDSFEGVFKNDPKFADLDLSKYSANDIAALSKNAETREKLTDMKSNRQIQLATRQDAIADRRQQNQDKVYTEANNKLTNPRGNTAVQQAMTGVASGKKAMDLINMYPNLNNMPAQQVSTLAQEIAKVASGGVGSEHGQQSLEANTVQSNWKKFVSNISGEPTGAELGAFIQQNKNYLENMTKTNQDTINNYGKMVYNGYKNRFTDDQDTQFKQDNPDLFKDDDKTQLAGSVAASALPPQGMASVVRQNGMSFKWDGQKYAPLNQVAQNGGR